MLQKLKADKISAMKAKDSVAKNILAFLLSESQNIAKAENREVTDSDVTKAAKSVIKKNQQTLDATNAPMPDIDREIEILKGFLPEQYTEKQLKSIIDLLFIQIPEDQRSPRMMGKIMGQLKEHGDAVDMSIASKYVKSLFQ